MTATFSKSPSSNTDLIALLKARGLHIPDARQAERALNTIGYYRLSGYTLLLETPGTFTIVGTTSLYTRSHTFRAGASFKQLLALQQFDQELHLMVLKALLKLEVAARSLINSTTIRIGI
jgi:abortive infection bacteriophage resistance protein